MSSLVERLRARTDRKPIYHMYESDDEADFDPKKSWATQQKFEKIVREDTKEGSCQACGEGGNLLGCGTCSYSYHPKCLVKARVPEDWSCPECVSPLNDIEKILECEMKPTVAAESDASTMGSNQIFVKQYLVKWKGLSYLHCTWVPEKEFFKAYKSLPRLKTRVNNFHRQMESINQFDGDFVAIRPEWTTVDRILTCRGEGDFEKEYLVKWKELSYDECYWEFESDISAFQHEIERFHRLQTRTRRPASGKQKDIIEDASEFKRKQKEFHQYEETPDFISGGLLHPYQIEGLNFLRFSHSNLTHVILADEMGLGKTIQSIAFLASLFEENPLLPHLVVAPLSTLRNWEREFATWAPQMNVVMYVGSSQARAVIREHEFYLPENSKKIKRKKSGKVVGESKQDRIKFDVLLTSYEMINLDSTWLKPIKWECMVVDEGHRLKNKDSKLFQSLKQYCSRQRVLLTGTPLQNNLDELYMLMHFLDAGKFDSLEEFKDEYDDISREKQIARLHKILGPHLLRRVKDDVMKDMPPKKELILRVDLSSKQKEYYKAILTRNYQILTRRAGPKVNFNNVVMELRKLCCHAYMLEGVEQNVEDPKEACKQLVESAGKLQLLDKLMVKLKEQGHRVLIYSQFRHMLDLLEDYCFYKEWQYERIDGKVGGADRQIRIDRFNAVDSSKFCFLLSTRAGGLGINLATADTVVLYDSDWNPHADLQAIARAHRLGQTKKVMIYRLVTRGTIEERMMELTKKKMVLEHLVVGKLTTQNFNQAELDDILRYGSKELFSEDIDESGKSRQIHYDDAAIDSLLDRDQIGVEDATSDGDEEDGFFRAFKVANFEYIEEEEGVTEKAERASYWEELLKDKYEGGSVDELDTLRDGKRSRKQMVSMEEDELAGFEDVSSDEAYGTDGDGDGDADIATTSSGRRPKKKKPCVESREAPPLMEGEGRSLKILGFNQTQRSTFVQLIMRFGVGEFEWEDFVPRMKNKTFEEIHEYGKLFLIHLDEGVTDSLTFSDGVPREGLRIQEVLHRIGQLILVHEKVTYLSENPNTPLFKDDIVLMHPMLKGATFWKEEHDVLLLRAVRKHGYGKWQAIVDDKELKFQELICREMNLPTVNLPVGDDLATQRRRYREVQRRYVEFIKKRVLLLEKGLYAEFLEKHFAELEANEGDAEMQDAEMEDEEVETEAEARDVPVPSSFASEFPIINEFQKIGYQEFSTVAYDNHPDRLELAGLYNKMCDVLDANVPGSSSANLAPIQTFAGNVNRILSPPTSTRGRNQKKRASSSTGGEGDKEETPVIVLDD